MGAKATSLRRPANRDAKGEALLDRGEPKFLVTVWVPAYVVPRSLRCSRTSCPRRARRPFYLAKQRGERGAVRIEPRVPCSRHLRSAVPPPIVPARSSRQARRVRLVGAPVDPLSTNKGGHVRQQESEVIESGSNARFGANRMEPLWSQAGATSGNRWQTLRARKPPKQAKTVAMGCHRLPIGAHGKEGVDGFESRQRALRTPW